MRPQQWKTKHKKFPRGSSYYVQFSVTAPASGSDFSHSASLARSGTLAVFSQAGASWVLNSAPGNSVRNFTSSMGIGELKKLPAFVQKGNSDTRSELQLSVALPHGLPATMHPHDWWWVETCPFSHAIHNVCWLWVFITILLSHNYNDLCTISFPKSLWALWRRLCVCHPHKVSTRHNSAHRKHWESQNGKSNQVKYFQAKQLSGFIKISRVETALPNSQGDNSYRQLNRSAHTSSEAFSPMQ